MATANDITQLATTLAQLAQTLAEQAERPEPEPEPQRQMPERVLLSVDEAAERLGIGRTLMFRLVRNGEIESVRIGRLRRVPVSAINEYAARLVHSTSNKPAA